MSAIPDEGEGHEMHEFGILHSADPFIERLSYGLPEPARAGNKREYGSCRGQDSQEGLGKIRWLPEDGTR